MVTISSGGKKSVMTLQQNTTNASIPADDFLIDTGGRYRFYASGVLGTAKPVLYVKPRGATSFLPYKDQSTLAIAELTEEGSGLGVFLAAGDIVYSATTVFNGATNYSAFLGAID